MVQSQEPIRSAPVERQWLVFDRENVSRRALLVVAIWFIVLALAASLGTATTLRMLHGAPELSLSISCIHLFVACCYLTPALYILRYYEAARDASASNHDAVLESALNAQHRFWQSFGIVIAAGALLFIAPFVIGMLF